MADELRVNGDVHGWGSIVLKVDGDRFYGFTSLTYGDKRERVHQWGMGRHHAPRGMSPGKYTPNDGKLGGPKASMQALRAALAAKASDGKSYGNTSFDITVQYIEAGSGPMTVEIQGCKLTENDSSEEESPDPLKEEITYKPMRILRNGLSLYDQTEGAP